MTVSLINSGAVYAEDTELAIRDLRNVKPETIKTHWDVMTLTAASDAEWSPDLDEMAFLYRRKLAALPRIASVLEDIFDLYGLLTINARALRSASREVSAWANCASAEMLAHRVERRAEIARTRFYLGKRLLAARAEREVLRGRTDQTYALQEAAE